MKTPKRPPLESLHHALKSWDPVRREGAPAAEEVARWRRRMLAVEAERRRVWRLRWRPALATLAAVLALVVLREDGRRPPPSSPPPVERPDERAAVGPRPVGRTGAAGGAERRGEQGGTVAGMPPAGSAEPGAPARGERAGDEERGRAAGESASRVRRHAATTPGIARPSALDPPAGRPPEPPADRDGTPWGDPSLQSIAWPADAGRSGEGTPGALATPAERNVGASAAAGQVESASSSDSPLATPPPPARSPDSVVAAAPPAPAAPPAFREVQIIAPGGTRIVWLIAAEPAPPADPFQEDT